MDAAARLLVAQQAVALVLADWTQQGAAAPDVTLWLDAADDVCIWVNGGGTTPSAFGDDRDQLTLSVSDYLQAELMEVEAAHRVWPTCPLHGAGLHPRPSEIGPAWWCVPGAHAVAAIGSLRPSLSAGGSGAE